MISVKNLYKSFGSHQVLNDINEHIAPGEKIVIIGPSGSGKSTFLRCMNLLERPTSGQIIFDGIDITDPKTDINKVRQHMGMVFQHFNLFPHKTIMENITLAPVRLKLMKPEEAKEEAIRLKAVMNDNTLNMLTKYVYKILGVYNLNCNYDINEEKCRCCNRKILNLKREENIDE